MLCYVNFNQSIAYFFLSIYSLQLNDNQIYLNNALAHLLTLKTDYTKEWYDNNWYCDYHDGLVRYLMMSISLVRSK
jgi:hypothetical protein